MTKPAKHTYRLQSTDMIYTPGIVAWAKNGYAFKDDRPKLVRLMVESYGLHEDVADGLLSGEIPYTVEDDMVVFDITGAE